MFQRKKDEIFRELPHVFGIADDYLIAGNDNNDADNDSTLHRGL